MMSVHLMHLSHANSRPVEEQPQIWSQLVSYRRRTEDYGLWLNMQLDGNGDQIASVTIENPFSMEVTLEGRAEEGSEVTERISR